MTWFTLPATQSERQPAFFDSDSASRWLAGQPQANASAMLDGLLAQLDAFNRYVVSPRERFKTLETLRKTLFATSGECRKRYENKPLPLSAVEQAMRVALCQLWRHAAIAYLHCLRACLEGDPGLAGHGAWIAHRVLACLRMEQGCAYLAYVELDEGFWSLLHASLVSAERLGVASEPVEDRLLGETSQSTVGGQYAMVLMLSLIDPYALSRIQCAAATRWLARWREQAAVLESPGAALGACEVALDLAQDSPLHTPPGQAERPRWLALGSVARKIRKRLAALAAGESPDSLKLGSVLSSEACTELLTLIGERLQTPVLPADNGANVLPISVSVGLESVFYTLGGRGLKQSPAVFGDRLRHEQLAVFDHVVRDNEVDGLCCSERWQLHHALPESLQLSKPPGSGDFRLNPRGLLAVNLPASERYVLAVADRLCVGRDGSLRVNARLLPGQAHALLAVAREKTGGRVSRHPAFRLTTDALGGDGMAIVPAGVPARSLSIALQDVAERNLPFRLHEVQERGSDHECWSLIAA